MMGDTRVRGHRMAPKTLGEMSDEEQGALMLAKHRGKEIQIFHINKWLRAINPKWFKDTAYRVKPEPVSGEVELFGNNCAFKPFVYNADTHRLIIPIVGGKLATGVFTNPDGYTIKLEEL